MHRLGFYLYCSAQPTTIEIAADNQSTLKRAGAYFCVIRLNGFFSTRRRFQPVADGSNLPNVTPGNVTMNVTPRPTSLSTAIWPP